MSNGITTGHQYVSMLYRGSFDSYAAAMASMETTDEEIVRFLEGAKAAGESVITIHWTPGPEQISPLFRVQPAPGSHQRGFSLPEGHWPERLVGDPNFHNVGLGPSADRQFDP